MPVILQVPPVFRRFVYPWITPAHAGKTSTPALTGFPLRDHPRACGENEKMSRQSALLMGSPPRMRGKLQSRGENRVSPGITPAHAGKTTREYCPQRRLRDHPRACGENSYRAGSLSLNSGSPPRMRGKRGEDIRAARAFGITPAHAGKTRKSTA